MNRQQGPGQSLRSLTNVGAPNSQPRNPVTSSRLVASKPGAWGSAGAAVSQTAPQSNEASSSWAQAMNPRTGSQLDFSSSSFPSLAGGSAQNQNSSSSSSQWQAGPPARDQTVQTQNTRILQQRQPTLSTHRDGILGPEPPSRNDFSPNDQFNSRFQAGPSLVRGAPPGLSPGDNTSIDPNSLTSPIGSQSRKSPIGHAVNGSIGRERPNGDIPTRSPQATQPLSGPPKDSFATSLSPSGIPDQSLDSLFKDMSERDKWGMAGWQALHDGPNAEYKALSRSQDLGSFGAHTEPGQSLFRSYAGPFAPSNAFPPRPLESDFSIPDCYIVQNVAPINQRISGFTEDTLFFIFYTSPKDIIQEEVATELMSRKWRFHVKEKMWLTRDDTTANPVILEKDVCEQGYYIWWDYRNWKRIRKAYILRYEDLDDHLSGGRSLTTPGTFQGGFGMMGGAGAGGINGGSSTTNSAGAGGDFNAVPGLERMAALGGRF